MFGGAGRALARIPAATRHVVTVALGIYIAGGIFQALKERHAIARHTLIDLATDGGVGRFASLCVECILH